VGGVLAGVLLRRPEADDVAALPGHQRPGAPAQHVRRQHARKKARNGAIRYVGSNGARTVKARRSNGRLATADFRGVSAEGGTYAAVSVREKMKKGGWRERSSS
jgi:hypothetical protein